MMYTAKLNLHVKDRQDRAISTLESLINDWFRTIEHDEGMIIKIDESIPDWRPNYEFDEEKNIGKEIKMSVVDLKITAKSQNMTETKLKIILIGWIHTMARDESFEVDVTEL